MTWLQARSPSPPSARAKTLGFANWDTRLRRLQKEASLHLLRLGSELENLNMYKIVTKTAGSNDNTKGIMDVVERD